MFRFIRNKIMYLFIITAAAYAFFGSCSIAIARDNAYLACFVDDADCMFKTQVIYSGTEIEMQRLGIFTNDQLGDSTVSNASGLITNDNSVTNMQTYIPDFLIVADNGYSRMPIMDSKHGFCYVSNLGFTLKNSKSGDAAAFTRFIISENGYPTLEVFTEKSESEITRDSAVSGTKQPTDINWSAAEDNNSCLVLPMTFPADTDADATNSDINRAYEVQDAISSDFQDALIFVNGGEKFTNIKTLFETAYYLATASDDVVVTINNDKGTKYTVSFIASKDETENYLKKVKITEYEGSHSVSSREFVFGVKKGYMNCSYGETTEAGTTNVVASEQLSSRIYSKDNSSGTVYDTEWITWEHLYLEASVLYSEGITYANQADLYTIEELESNLIKLTRTLLNGLKGFLQTYSIEELFFNQGIRGGKAFVYGAYYSNWSSSLTTIFLLFASIALSVIMFSLINMINKKQMSLMSPTARYSLIEDVKMLIFAVFALSSVWWIIKFLLLMNFRFVNIWSSYVGSKTLTTVSGSSSILASLVLQFAFFVMEIYVNFLYITRSLFLAALIVLSPLFIVAMTFGFNGQQLSRAWFKELIGYIFIQSIHAFVYGFVIAASPGLRGIESVVVVTSIIPLTSLVKDLMGLGLNHLTQQASSLTGTAMSTIRGATSLVGSVGGKVIGGSISAVGGIIGGAVGGPVGSTIGTVAGNIGKGTEHAINGTADLANAFSGIGQNLATRTDSRAIESNLKAAGKEYARALDAMSRPPV